MQQVVRRGWLAAGTGAVGPSPRESSLSAHCLLAGAVVPGATESPGQGQVPRGGSAPGGRGQGGHAGSPTECGRAARAQGDPAPKPPLPGPLVISGSGSRRGQMAAARPRSPGDKRLDACRCTRSRLEPLNKVSWPLSSQSCCLVMLMGRGDPGTAALTWLLKIIGHPQFREKCALLSLAGKCELFSCCHRNQDKFPTSSRYLIL